MSSTPHLPIILAEQVIDCLRGDQASLLACTTTCQSWLPRARWHLYNTISLFLPGIQPTSNELRFFDTLRANPSLCKLVEELELLIGRHPDMSHVVAAKLGPAPRGASDWPSTLGLGRLCNVRTLHLTHADVDDLEVLLSILRLFPQLEHLFLEAVTVGEQQGTARGADKQLAPPELRSLTIGRSYQQQVFAGMLPCFQPGGVFARLELLVVHEMCRERNTRLAWMRIPSLIRVTLRELFVNLSRSEPLDEGEIWKECTALVDSLWTCAALRSLEILHHHGPFLRSPFSVLVELFASSDAALPELRSVTLTLGVSFVEEVEIDVGEHVAQLSETLLDRARFPSFERVVVRNGQRRYGISSAAEVAAWRKRTSDAPSD